MLSCVPVVMLSVKAILPFEPMDEILKCNHANEIKDTEQYFLVVLFILLPYKVFF